MSGVSGNSSYNYFNLSTSCSRLDCFGLFGSRQPNSVSNGSPRNSEYGSFLGRYAQVPTDNVTRSYDLQSLGQGAQFITTPLPKLPIGYNFKEDPDFKNIVEHDSSKEVLAKGFGGSIGLTQNTGIPLLNMFHVMLGETIIDKSSFLGPLTMGNREDSAGPHGHFYAVLFSEDFSHKAYLVPNDDIKQFLVKEVTHRNLQNQDDVISKIVTYKEYYRNITSDSSGSSCIPS